MQHQATSPSEKLQSLQLQLEDWQVLLGKRQNCLSLVPRQHLPRRYSDSERGVSRRSARVDCHGVGERARVRIPTFLPVTDSWSREDARKREKKKEELGRDAESEHEGACFAASLLH